jgi:epoxyqueuosine reductase
MPHPPWKAQPVSHEPPSLTELVAFIESVVRDSSANRLPPADEGPIFERPLVGVADGDDPLFLHYKDIIGPHHLTPRDFIRETGSERAPVNIRVLCWVLPISTATRRSNAAMKLAPSRRWSRTKHYGELFNDELRRCVERYLQHRGVRAVAPAISPLFQSIQDTSGHPTSTWSERHALYAAGLGTFGLCDGFLTPVGKAMRCGSIVVALPLQLTPRTYASHTAACPYLARGQCGVCINRCPAGAIGPEGHDRIACQRYQDETLVHLRAEHGVEETGCGLCQTAVPCEAGLPR